MAKKRLKDLDKVARIRVINHRARRAVTFRGLDHCANLARKHGEWSYCEPDIHERNMTMLGKDGYGQAVYQKGWHVVIVNNEFATKADGHRIHARKLSQSGYRFIGSKASS
jgi:hypothetical protein